MLKKKTTKKNKRCHPDVLRIVQRSSTTILGVIRWFLGSDQLLLWQLPLYIDPFVLSCFPYRVIVETYCRSVPYLRYCFIIIVDHVWWVELLDFGALWEMISQSRSASVVIALFMCPVNLFDELGFYPQ